MKTRTMRKIAVLATGSALTLSLPVAGAVANPVGVPSDGNGHSKACHHVGKGKGPKKSAHNSRGHKCGFDK
jgi:hypothetical protein